MEGLNRILDRFTDGENGSLHGAAFMVIDSSGNVIYEHAAGRLEVDSKNESPLRTDSLCWIASMSKVVTAVAAMQLVERELIGLDDDVRELLPELAGIQVLEGFKECAPNANDTSSQFDNAQPRTEPILRAVEGNITLRSSPMLQKWSKLTGRDVGTFSGSLDGYNHPLLFAPGTSWGYGGGIDWAGRVIERLTGLTLEEYLRANLWSGLGMESTTFHPEWYREKLPAQLEMGHRVKNSNGTNSVKLGHIMMQYPLQDDIGGIGLFSTPQDFSKLLAALIRGGDPILSRHSVDILFQPQLNDESRTAMPKFLGVQMRRVLGIDLAVNNGQVDHCLAGTMTLRDIPFRRRRGTVNWSGLPNLHWWIDRETGIAATLFTQLMPPGDSLVVDLLIELEEALYAHIQDLSTQNNRLHRL